jgi:hypothetical protein
VFEWLEIVVSSSFIVRSFERLMSHAT